MTSTAITTHIFIALVAKFGDAVVRTANGWEVYSRKAALVSQVAHDAADTVDAQIFTTSLYCEGKRVGSLVALK